MKRVFVLLFGVMYLVGCERNEVVDPTQSDIDSTKLNQPEDPATWSPVGHKYVSNDENDFGRYDGREITFISADTIFWHRTTDKNVKYSLDYPYIYLRNEEYPWLMFIDTLTISKVFDGQDESSRYELVY